MPVELDDLLAFNEEIVSLALVGVPLPLGLEAIDPDPRVAIGRINTELLEQMGRGEALAGKIDELATKWPTAYAAAIKTGLRCDDLSVALKSILPYSTNRALFDRRAAASLLYPLTVVTLASLLFVFFCSYVAPALVEFWKGMNLPLIGFVGYLDVGATQWPWIAAELLIVVAAIWWGWFRMQRGSQQSSPRATWLDRLPVMRSIAYDYACAELAEMLAVLTQHRVSLADSLRLAADAAAHSELREVVLSQMTDRRQDTSVDRPARRRLPSFLQWLLDQGDQVPGFVDMLRLAATTYRERGDRRARRVRFAVPILACLFVAGGITLFYALLLFWPMVQTLRQLS